MIRYKAARIFIAIIFLSGRIPAQEPKLTDRLVVEANYHYGFVMPHSDFIAYFVEKHVQAFQLNVGLKTTGSKPWHQSYNNPVFGLGYVFSGLGNDKVYGSMHALFAYTDRYYLSHHRRFNIGNRLGLGLALATRHFDLHTDPTNLAIGSALNIYVSYSVEATCRLVPKLYLKTGWGLTHISNGSFRQPNKGLNLSTAFAGFVYEFNSDVKSAKNTTIHPDSSRNQFYVSTIFGRKQISRNYDDAYSVTGISGEYLRLITGNSWGGASLSLYYDPSLVKELELTDTLNYKKSKNFRLAVNAVYELKMGRISYDFQPGIYLINSFKKNGMISNKLAIRYQINKQLVAGMAIKAHWFAIADFFEWSIGYTLKT